MAARTISMDELGAAVKEYAARNGKDMSSNEKGFVIMPGDVLVGLQDGKPTCNDPGILYSLVEILMDLAEEPTRAPQKPNFPARKVNTPAPTRNGNPGQMAQSVQAIQAMSAGKDLMYQVGKQKAPTANLALMAATDAGIILEEIDRTHTAEFVSSTVRATSLDGRHVDATVSLMKQDFVNLLAWKAVQEQEILKNNILDDSDPLNVALPNGFPRILPDATIKTRVKDGNNSIVIERKAITEIYIKIMNQWIFQQRQCQTKAKRNAVIQLLTSSGNPTQTMEPEELADEAMEVELVEASA